MALEFPPRFIPDNDMVIIIGIGKMHFLLLKCRGVENGRARATRVDGDEVCFLPLRGGCVDGIGKLFVEVVHGHGINPDLVSVIETTMRHNLTFEQYPLWDFLGCQSALRGGVFGFWSFDLWISWTCYFETLWFCSANEAGGEKKDVIESGRRDRAKRFL